MASSGKLSSRRAEIKYIFFTFCGFSKMIFFFFYEVQRILVLFHSSGVFPASGEKKKIAFEGRGSSNIVTDIFGWDADAVERIFTCKRSSPWNKRTGFMSAVCRGFWKHKVRDVV